MKPLLTPFRVKHVIVRWTDRPTEKISFERFLDMRATGELSGVTYVIVEDYT